MLSRRHRFHGLGSLKFVYNRGQTVRGPLMSLKFIENQRRTSYRCAVVVAKKVSKSAVVRNRIRRRVYEIVRSHETQFNHPYDIVISVFHEQVADMPAAELAKTLGGLLRQAGLLSDIIEPQN